jgi:predicted nucleic acid-binding protein
LYVCHKIVLDHEKNDEDNIIDEYNRQALSELTKRWLITIKEKGKTVIRNRAPMTVSVITDPDDQKYFQVAVNSPHRIIISEDRHFTNIAEHEEVTCRGISIWDLDQALSEL